MTKGSAADILEEIRKILQYHHSLGIREYPRTLPLESFLQNKKGIAPAQNRSKPKSMKAKTSQDSERKHLFDPALAKRTTLQDVRQELGECQRCRLHATRSNIVFGQGPESAKLMIIADAPFQEDDHASLPLQGEPGKLLDKMLEAINLSRDDVYITNLVKCFPGTGEKSGENEIKTCLPFLFRQIEIICPTVICAMGPQSSQSLLRSRRSLFQLRGRFYNFNDLCSSKLADKIMLMPSLHPALLLENPELKKASWQDLQLIQKKLEEGQRSKDKG